MKSHKQSCTLVNVTLYSVWNKGWLNHSNKCSTKQTQAKRDCQDVDVQQGNGQAYSISDSGCSSLPVQVYTVAGTVAWGTHLQVSDPSWVPAGSLALQVSLEPSVFSS